jgi:hypothetical protein
LLGARAARGGARSPLATHQLGLRRARAPGVALAAVLTAISGCQPAPSAALDPALIWVSSDAKVRTDTVGDGAFASQATFVLVDAENRSPQAAMITLAGTFRDGAGVTIGTLRPESLWVPAGQRRLFALVDRDRLARPGARGAQILVSGAKVAARPPIMRVTAQSSYDDYGKLVTRARLVNDADRPGRAMVFSSFYDARHQPMARPFSLIPIAAKSELPLQLVGPPGSRFGEIFLGDIVY